MTMSLFQPKGMRRHERLQHRQGLIHDGLHKYFPHGSDPRPFFQKQFWFQSFPRFHSASPLGEKKNMHERPQQLVCLQEKGEPSSEPSDEGDSSSFTRCPTQPQPSLPDSNLDPLLFNDLVQIVPLVQSLIDGKASSSFNRWGSMIYTKKPSRESLCKRITDFKNKEEFILLKKQMEDLQRKLLVKDVLSESAENSRNQLSVLNEKLDELRHQAAEKDSLLKSAQQQLLNVKMKLADKQAALEKTQWEAMTSNKKAEKLQEQIDSMQGDILSFTILLEGLAITNTAEYADDFDIKPYELRHLSNIDYLEMESQKMEEARNAYIATVAAAKEKQDEDSIATAANARLHLQSFLFKTNTSDL